MIDWPLITSLVERWWLETHAFHVPISEMSITLHDVAIILGFRIHRPAIIGTCVFDVAELFGELFGVTPPANALRGFPLSIRWLCDQLSTPAPNADDVTLERSKCGFILALLGSFLFADKKGVHVHLYFLPLQRDLTQTAAYSWGSAILAQLYRELCQASLERTRSISCCITLLQVSITLFYYILIHVHIVSLVCLLFVYFVCSSDLGRDFMWGDPI